jgi:bifunctional non-homologous end joining protein LigD
MPSWMARWSWSPPTGGAAFDLLGGRVHGRRRIPDGHPVTFYVFDVLERDGQDLTCRTWTERRHVLDDLDLAERSGGCACPTVWTADGAAMHEATRSIAAEGTVSKRADSTYRPGRSRQWRKAKHKTVQTLQVAGWRPSTPGRPGGLLVAENGEPRCPHMSRERRRT